MKLNIALTQRREIYYCFADPALAHNHRSALQGDFQLTGSRYGARAEYNEPCAQSDFEYPSPVVPGMAPLLTRAPALAFVLITGEYARDGADWKINTEWR